MSLVRNTLLAAALVAVAGLAAVGVSHTHVTTVRLPDGSTETIAAFGDSPPHIRLVPRPVLVPLDDPFAPDPVFADLARTAQVMDQQAADMMRLSRLVDAMAPGAPGGLPLAAALGGPGVCVRSVEYHYSGDGRPPKIVRHASGECGAARDPGPAVRRAPGLGVEAADRPSFRT
jgi:hypothetical protein